MKNYKSKFDFNRPFKLIHKRSQFDQIKTTDFLFNTHEREQSSNKQKSKQQIAVPNIQIIQSLTKPKKFAKITPNYIRISQALSFPKENQYQLTEIDYYYLKSHHANLFNIDKNNVLNQQFFKKCIIELQTKASHLTRFPLTSKWLMDYIHRDHKQLLSMHNLESMVNSLYNYWRNRRQQMRFPLYRLFWRDDPYQADNLKPFKRRTIAKRNLRKSAQIDQQLVIEQVISQFNNALLVCDRIQARQDLKMKNIQLQIVSFHKECQQYFKISEQWKEYFEPINRQNDKQKSKKLKQQTQKFKQARIQQKNAIENIQVPKTQLVIDKKQTLVNFLASVLHEADQKGISYESIYQTNRTLQVIEDNKFKSDSSSTWDIQKKQTYYEVQPIVETFTEEKYDTISVSLHKCRDLIFRSFDLQSQDSPHNQIADTIVQYRRKRLSQYYFGDDDDIGQYKDLRKNINNSFKRFLQLNNSNLNLVSNK